MGVFRPILDLLFPPRCVFCRGFLQKSGSLCSCADTLPYCQGEAAIQQGEYYSLCVSPFTYEGNVRDSHHRYKFQGASFYSRTYAPYLATCIATHCWNRYDLISWVPLSRKRLRERGYDQARLLAEDTARELGGRAVPTLRKVKNTAAQSGLGGPEERRANISEAYAVLDGALIAGKRILLVDDVSTTGSTLSECARCLLLAGAEEVICATLARSSES